MKLIRLPRFGWLVAVMCVPAVLAGGEVTEQELGSFRRPAGDAAESVAADRAKGIVAELAGTASFAKWRRFEDNKVTFSYPDHEAIRVEVKLGDAATATGIGVRESMEEASSVLAKEAGGAANSATRPTAAFLSDVDFGERIATKADSTGVRRGHGAAGTGPAQGTWKFVRNPGTGLGYRQRARNA